MGAIPPAVTALWALGQVGADSVATADLVWVEQLDLGFVFRVDSFAAMMTLLVSGIGALVFVYAYGYFSPTASDVGRFAAALLSFSTAMLGLVWADSVWTLFIFWELTSVTSFILVGHKRTDQVAQAAARRALMITGAGGLVLLAGLLLLAAESGTTIISDLQPMAGGTAPLAAVLILLGAASKSAQVPFHVWLPGAMTAPTPVSAYLHSATMVKAGVVLVAVVGSAFADVDTWSVLGIGLGVASILWGAIGALRHRDAKLILAWGTVSQLGLMITLLVAGSGKAVFAAVSILFAHALFKATLFLVVGAIDIRTGTRTIDDLVGLRRTMPVTFVIAVAAAASMAGVPPLLGFAAKEAAIEATLKLDGLTGFMLALGVIGGSVLTVAYTVRLIIGLFWGDGEETEVAPVRLAMLVPAAILGAAGLVFFVVLGPIDDLVRDSATELTEKAAVYELLRWPGLTAGFAISMAIVAGGTVLGVLFSRSTAPAPNPVGADASDSLLDQVLVGSRWATGKIQHGSLPVYVLTMAAMAVVASIRFLSDLNVDHVFLWDGPLQGALAVAIVISAAAMATLRTRLSAALALGAVGAGVSGLFAINGAPDLVLTQLLVETVIVVGFVVGFGHLPPEFPTLSQIPWRRLRVAWAVLGGAAVTAALAASSANPTGEAPIDEIATQSVDVGGGNNMVNVILTDLRALDTVGEVVVVATVAVGILALARTNGSKTGADDDGNSDRDSDQPSGAELDPEPAS
ncbi:MAG: hydrogen gas-evolving membrane-bound hydrogenase subunit E [Actinomycetota bacterium]